MDARTLDLSRFPGRVIATRTIPPREAVYAPLPEGLHPALKDALPPHWYAIALPIILVARVIKQSSSAT